MQLIELSEGPLRTQIRLSADLETWPDVIYRHATTLEELDLSNNKLSSLPADFHRFTQLKRLFLTNNQFRDIPAVLATCPRLTMVSFKGNQLQTFAEGVLSDALQWLILTDNQLTALPEDFGRYQQLQKLALAGNQLRSLPESMQQCQQLGLIRLSLNQFPSFPDWLFRLPQLAWLALGANPATPVTLRANTPTDELSRYQLLQPLGAGASGVIYQAISPAGDTVAVKVFKGWITSDGCPRDELANYLNAGNHRNLIPIVANLTAEHLPALAMQCVPERFQALGQPPSFATITRDTFAVACRFDKAAILTMAKQVASVMAHLHQQHIVHGDLYAHNMLVSAEGELYLGDFGAATALEALPVQQQQDFKALEVRAFGYWLADMLALCAEPSTVAALTALQASLLHPEVTARPNFEQIEQSLAAM